MCTSKRTSSCSLCTSILTICTQTCTYYIQHDTCTCTCSVLNKTHLSAINFPVKQVMSHVMYITYVASATASIFLHMHSSRLCMCIFWNVHVCCTAHLTCTQHYRQSCICVSQCFFVYRLSVQATTSPPGCSV